MLLQFASEIIARRKAVAQHHVSSDDFGSVRVRHADNRSRAHGRMRKQAILDGPGTDPVTGTEYILTGRSTGTSFIDISDPANPVYVGDLPTHTVASDWRDIKVYADHAFIVSEAAGHGMQVFDLTRLSSAMGSRRSSSNSACAGCATCSACPPMVGV